MIRVIAALLIVAALAGLWWHGYTKGKNTDKQRSDLVIAGMVNDAQARLASANENVRLANAGLQAAKERSERERETERARHERRLADQRATDSLVREQAAEFARGPGADQDSIAAANQRAATLGQLLGESVQLQAELAGAAEAESDNVRALLKAWPKLTENP